MVLKQEIQESIQEILAQAIPKCNIKTILMKILDLIRFWRKTSTVNVTTSNCELSRGATQTVKGAYCHSYSHWVNPPQENGFILGTYICKGH